MTCAHRLTALLPVYDGYERVCAHCGAPVEGLPQLPPGGHTRCPMPMPDGEPCGGALIFAHSVREYHPVLQLTDGRLVVGDRNDMDPVPDPDTLYCSAGHEWAVPETVVLSE